MNRSLKTNPLFDKNIKEKLINPSLKNLLLKKFKENPLFDEDIRNQYEELTVERFMEF